MRVAVVTVLFNSADVLDSFADHVAALDVEKVVAVDNASEDNSRSLASVFADEVLALPENVGFGRAVNVALDRCEDMDACLILNPDCFLTQEALSVLLDCLASDSRIGATTPRMIYLDGTEGISCGSSPSMLKEWLAFLRIDRLVPQPLRRILARLHGVTGWPKFLEYDAVHRIRAEAPEEKGWLSAYCMLGRMEALRSVGGFDDAFFLYFEDVDLSLRLRDRGWMLMSEPRATALHLESTSTSKVGKSRHYYSGMRTYFDLHGTVIQRKSARMLGRLVR